MRCPVCGFEIDNKTTKCPDCDFNEFKSEFLNQIEYENWMLNIVVSHRDCYVNTLLNTAIEQIKHAKHLIKDRRNNGIWSKIKENEYDTACDNVRKDLEKIESLRIYWLVKSVVKIEYTEHMGFFDYQDNIKYTYEFSKKFLKIEYERKTSEKCERGTYENLGINSTDFLRKIFEEDKLHELKHPEEEEWNDDGASWDIKMHLAYPAIHKTFEKESYWKYHERNNPHLNTNNYPFNTIEQWQWINVHVNYLLESSGQFNQTHRLLINAIGEYIKELPKNIETTKYDEIDFYDVW